MSDRSSRVTHASPRRQGTCGRATLRSAAAATTDPPAAPPPPPATHGSMPACMPSSGGPTCHAARSARCARYRRRPPLRATSRLSVDGLAPTGEPGPAATRPPRHHARSPPAQRETSAEPTAAELPAVPPEASTNARIDAADLPSRRPIDRIPFAGSPPIPHLDPLRLSEHRHNNLLDEIPQLSRRASRSPPETTADMCGCGT